jgi:hypothetical protein
VESWQIWVCGRSHARREREHCWPPQPNWSRAKPTTCHTAAYVRFETMGLAMSDAVVLVRLPKQRRLFHVGCLAKPSMECNEPCEGSLMSQPAQLPADTFSYQTTHTHTTYIHTYIHTCSLWKLTLESCVRASAHLRPWVIQIPMTAVLAQAQLLPLCTGHPCMGGE